MNILKLSIEPETEANKVPLANERGVVLILVLVMMTLLLILGATVLTSSTTEIRLAGNIRNQQQAFYIAQGALELAPATAAVLNAMGNVGDTWTGTIAMNGSNIVATQGALTALPTGTQNVAQLHVEYSASTTPPRGSGASADAFTANYYEFNVIGKGPNDSEVEIISEVYRLQAKDTAY